jgi:hypothetical protein
LTKHENGNKNYEYYRELENRRKNRSKQINEIKNKYKKDKDLKTVELFLVIKIIINKVPAKRVKKKLCHKIFEKPRKKQKFDNIFDRFCLNHIPLYSNCFLPTRKQQNTNTVENKSNNFNKTIYL